MYRNRKLVRAIQHFFQQFQPKSPSTVKEQSLWLLRSFIVTKKRPDWVNAGFVLPTVAMVSLVVVLLTIAILFRSFERSKNASNVRVNQAVLNAATPAIDRARAKINQLIEDPLLPRSTFSDLSLNQVLDTSIDKYTFGDETQLKLTHEFNGTDGIQSEEKLNSAWKYPVDTDNDGKFDSYTLYAIYYRTPTTTRARNPLEARTQPMDEGARGSQCNTDVTTSADLVGTQGWYRVGGSLKRSFFVYTSTVPITDITGLDTNKYQQFKGNKGFVALEYQQDRERIPLPNNAVLYEDDLEITPGEGLNLNGRIFTNGNLLTRKDDKDIRYYLVSSPKSCYFTESNSKILVAGNVINSRVNESTGGQSVKVDLYKNLSTNATIDNTQKTVTAAVYGNTAAFNSKAYADRIERLVEATNSDTNFTLETSLPDEVQSGITKDITANPAKQRSKARDEQLTIYFRKRTRRVPYAEVLDGGNAIDGFETTKPIQGTGNALRPIDAWVFPFDPSDGTNATNYAKVGINPHTSGNKIYLSATDPDIQRKADKEDRIGDRVLVGNNLPQLWYDTTKNKFISPTDDGQVISGKEWDNNDKQRKRYSQAYQLDDLGITDRDDFWERSAAQQPSNPLDVVGGLRIVTGAGIYLPTGSTPSTFTNTEKTVWSDAMPVGVTNQAEGLPNNNTPYLQMRATAVYHYQHDSYDPTDPTNYQAPIACVSSYYDPTNSTTAKNRDGLPDVSLRDTSLTTPNRDLTGLLNVAAASGGNSRNGVVYGASSLSASTYSSVLTYQAELKYPNGRWVNEPLKDALAQQAASKPLSLSQQSAIDSAVCALKILDGTIGAPTDAEIPHGSIMETAFLDARQIKAIDKPSNPRTYDLDVEMRQPLEIRSTIVDLDLLRRKSRTAGEFLFPNSGLIYATRDDAIADASIASSEEKSATDFNLDPTRRPNGIMLINGSDLSRNATYVAEEKGLILASNLPVYIKGDFNVHTQEEFTDNPLKNANTATFSANFYARTTLNSDFACRQGQPSCGANGENWRPTTVLGDAITVLSSNFLLGFRNQGDYELNNNYDTIDKDGNPVLITFDADGSAALGNVNESDFGFDLNGNGNVTDTNVSETNGITTSAAAKIQGFWDNNFVTSYRFGNTENSSYLNNFVTPIQRRVSFTEYVMETCPKKMVTACQPNDWVVGYDLNENGNFDDPITLNGRTILEKNIKANELIQALGERKNNSGGPRPVTDLNQARLWAGTTGQPARDQSLPRRVAFLRHRTGLIVGKGTSTTNPVDGTISFTTNITGANNTLVLDPADQTPIPIGVFSDTSGKKTVRYFPYSNTLNINGTDYVRYSSTNKPRLANNSLWFLTNNASAKNYGYDYPLWIENTNSLTGTRPTEQPLLIPVLQIQVAFENSGDSASDRSLTRDIYLNNQANIKDRGNNWLQKAVDTETNLIFAQGNTPGRPSETNGGLENFVRYLEDWEGKKHNALGAFIQYKRSSYATAPWQMFTANYVSDSGGYSTSATGTIFGYPQGYRTSVNSNTGLNLGRTPFYIPPQRFWGYDVALLTQLPDLFSQRFTVPATGDPNEFYREVGRDDTWVKTLLCASKKNSAGTADEYAIPSSQRPTCP